MVRLPLLINRQRIKTLEELHENFNLVELIERYRGGQLRAWLNCWDFNSELEQLEALSADLSDQRLAEALCRIFCIEGDTRERALTVIRENLLKQEQERLCEEQRKREQQKQEEQQKAELAKALTLFEWQEQETKLSGSVNDFSRFAGFDPYLCIDNDALLLYPRNNLKKKRKEQSLCYTYDGYHWQPAQSLPIAKTAPTITAHSWEGIGKYFRCNFVSSPQEFGVVLEGSAAQVSDDGNHWNDLEYGIQELTDMGNFLVALLFDTQSPGQSMGFYISLDGINWRKLSTPLPKGKLACFRNSLLIMYGNKIAFGKISVQDVKEAFNGNTQQLDN